jgi:S1-C subfamily serine protease
MCPYVTTECATQQLQRSFRRIEMSGWKKTLANGLTMALALLIAAPLAAQEGARDAKEVEQDARRIEAQIEDRERRAETVEIQMREAEERLAEAAARVAELSSSRLPEIARRFQGNMHPVMGITIGTDGMEGPVEGVAINGVTPGSAAEDAGLRAGDVITSINGESLGADDDEKANRKLLDFMEGVEEDDTLDVEYLRNGRTAKVELKPRAAPNFAFAFRPGNRSYAVPAAPMAPGVFGVPGGPGFFSFYAGSGSWGDMEMVSLTEDLGRYFGTDKGLLIVRAPEDESLKLRDGDVIQSIDGREPSSVSHAMRILGSYQSGETLKLEIMRDKRRQTVSVEVPDNRRSAIREFGYVVPSAGSAPAPSAARERSAH